MFLLSSKDWIRRRLHHLGHCHRMLTRHDIGKIRQTQEVTKYAGSDQESGSRIRIKHQNKAREDSDSTACEDKTWDDMGNIRKHQSVPVKHCYPCWGNEAMTE